MLQKSGLSHDRLNFPVSNRISLNELFGVLQHTRNLVPRYLLQIWHLYYWRLQFFDSKWLNKRERRNMFEWIALGEVITEDRWSNNMQTMVNNIQTMVTLNHRQPIVKRRH